MSPFLASFVTHQIICLDLQQELPFSWCYQEFLVFCIEKEDLHPEEISEGSQQCSCPAASCYQLS